MKFEIFYAYGIDAQYVVYHSVNGKSPSTSVWMVPGTYNGD